MAFAKSTPEELAAAHALVAQTEARMAALAAAGTHVHVIWDVDFVLADGRSDDSFAILGFDVAKYFTLEERLIGQRLGTGLWLRTARKCGELQQSQDVVTARSSFLAMRVMFYLLSWTIPVRWQLFVGHQSKKESYRIILASFQKQERIHVFMVDDAKKHVDAFNEVAAELGMQDRCTAVQSPQIRDSYDEPALRAEVAQVIGFAPDAGPQYIDTRETSPDGGRSAMIVPDPQQLIHDFFRRTTSGTVHKEAVVHTMGQTLRDAAAQLMPGRQHTTDDLYLVYDLVRSP